jgi:hypothetical protein
MTKLRSAVCPVCSTEVSVTYWPYNMPLYTIHSPRGSNRECRQSLRPVADRPAADTPRPT